MALVSAEVVPTPGEGMPYKIIFKQEGALIGEVPVPSLDAGEAIALDIIVKLRKLAEEEGHA